MRTAKTAEMREKTKNEIKGQERGNTRKESVSMNLEMMERK
jgi:hypothetical protein